MPIEWRKPSLRKLTSHPGHFYSYAACALQRGDDTHVWWCQNVRDGVIKDSLFYGTIGRRTPAAFDAPPRAVFRAADAGQWDSFHVCDPSVVAGRFRFDGRPYGFALFYLGNDVDDSRHNQVGVAFANRLEGPWTRAALPVVGHADDGSWGAGQPSAINVDGGGRVQLFYTRGDRGGTVCLVVDVDLSDVRSSVPLTSDPRPVPITGLTQTDGKPDICNNADFAYCRPRDRYFVIREQHPRPLDNPRYIGANVQIASIVASDLHSGRGNWQVEGVIDPSLTGLSRNHNAGFVRDADGCLPSLPEISIVFASSDAASAGLPPTQRAEWTYDLFQIEGTLR